MFLPILLSLSLLGASATSVGKGNCPTDAELLKSFSAPSKTLDLNWLAQMKEKCANGNCEEVSKEIWDISREREAIINTAYQSLSCRFDTYTNYDCYKYNMPLSQADEIIPGLGKSIFERKSDAINKIRPYRNELLYRVGWYKEPEFEGCNDNALPETPIEEPEEAWVRESASVVDEHLETPAEEPAVAADYEADVSDDEDWNEDYEADVSDNEDWDDWNGVDVSVVGDTALVVDAAPTGIASYDNYLAGEGLLLVEGTTPVADEASNPPVEEMTPVVEETIEEQASLFAQKQKSNNIMLKVLTNTLEAYSDTVEETTPAVEETTLVVEETREAPVEETTPVEAEPENQLNKPASKSRWKFWQRRAA